MNDIEELMKELVRSSLLLKHKLYRRDDVASTSPEGMDGPHIAVHTCRLCNRSAAGEGAQVRHKSDCALAKMQRAQKDLYGAWPELFAKKLDEKAPPSKCKAHLKGEMLRV